MGCARGKRVRTLEALSVLALEKRAVTGNHPIFQRRHQPAAWVINMSAAQVLQVFRAGLFACRPRAKG